MDKTERTDRYSTEGNQHFFFVTYVMGNLKSGNTTNKKAKFSTYTVYTN